MGPITPATREVLDAVESSCDDLDEKLRRAAQHTRTAILRLARDRDVPRELAESLRVLARDAGDLRTTSV